MHHPCAYEWMARYLEKLAGPVIAAWRSFPAQRFASRQRYPQLRLFGRGRAAHTSFSRERMRKIIESAQPFSSKMHSRFHRRCTPIFMKVHTQGAVLRTHARVDSGI